MKKIVALIIATVLMLSLLTGCIHVNVSLGTLRGSGHMVSEEYKLKDYSRASISGNFDLVCADLPSGQVQVEIQDNLLPHLRVEVRNGTLYVDADRDFRYDSGKRGVIYISADDLTSLELAGAINVSCTEQIGGDNLSLQVDGACDVELDLDVDSLTIVANGASSVHCVGEADSFRLTQNGAGSVDMLELAARDGRVEINGAGSCSVNCTDTLDVEINGAGSVTYRGKPAISQSIAGIGVIKAE